MESVTYAVQKAVQLTEVLDGLDELQPMPKSIKDQMPVLAGFLQELSADLGREHVAAIVRASIDLRRAYDCDDRNGVSAVYARKEGWATCAEGGFQLGIPDVHMSAFANRHRTQP